MSTWTKIRNSITGVLKPVVAVAASISPQVKAIALTLGIGSTTVAAIPETGTLEEKVTALIVAGVSYLVHKAFYMIEDYADDKKLNKSVRK